MQFQNSVIVQLFMFISEILKALMLRVFQGHPTLTPNAALGSPKVHRQEHYDSSQRKDTKKNAINRKSWETKLGGD